MFVTDAPTTPIGATPLPRALGGVPLELIEREIEQLAADINAGSARWLELVGEFDRRTGWANTGCRSTSEWVAWRCALTSRSARERVRVARALPELPLVRAAFARGELSYSKVRALTRVADRESEVELLELARHATAAQLERMIRAARRASAAEAAEAQCTSFLRWHWDERDGSLRLEGKLPPEDGALLLRALEAARDALHDRRLADAEGERGDGSAGPLAARGPSGSAEPPARELPRVPSPTNVESIAAVAEAALARPPTGLTGGERYQVLVHVDASSLATDEPGASVSGPGACALADGPGIAAETARRLACDSSLVTLVERDGEPLSVGRKALGAALDPPGAHRARRALPVPRLRASSVRRRPPHRHRAQGGETSLENLVLLCRHHHRLVHEGGYSVKRTAGRLLEFRGPDGRPLPVAPALPASLAAGLPIAEGKLLPGTGEKMDLACCVDAVLAAATAPAARAAAAPG